MKILVPAAGEGSRFREAGWHTPKPLIRVIVPNGGEFPMMVAVTNRVESRSHVYYGVKPRNIEEYGAAIDGNTVLPWTIIEAPRHEGGQSATLLDLCDNVGDLEEPCLVYNSDVIHDFSPRILVQKAGMFETNCMVVVRRTDDPSFSYVDHYPFFHYAVEKRVISNFGITGLYWFRTTEMLRATLQDQLDNGRPESNGEFYISDALGRIPEPRGAVLVRKDVYDIGTPEKLTAYEDMITMGVK